MLLLKRENFGDAGANRIRDSDGNYAEKIQSMYTLTENLSASRAYKSLI
jgi:hypothetical protein